MLMAPGIHTPEGRATSIAQKLRFAEIEQGDIQFLSENDVETITDVVAERAKLKRLVASLKVGQATPNRGAANGNTKVSWNFARCNGESDINSEMPSGQLKDLIVQRELNGKEEEEKEVSLKARPSPYHTRLTRYPSRKRPELVESRSLSKYPRNSRTHSGAPKVARQ
jgi:hypothetical protein